MAILSTALTTVARVKTRMDISESTWDTLLAELINGASQTIEAFLGRPIIEATYSNEVYSLESGQRVIYLRKYPVTAISAIQYRIGTPDVPSWTSFLASEYELVNDGTLGMVRIYAPASGTNNFRISYTAGWQNSFSTGHTLPYAISDICEKMVVYRFKKRTNEGKSSEQSDGSGVTWREDDIPAIDKKVLQEYRRTIFV